MSSTLPYNRKKEQYNKNHICGLKNERYLKKREHSNPSIKKNSVFRFSNFPVFFFYSVIIFSLVVFRLPQCFIHHCRHQFAIILHTPNNPHSQLFQQRRHWNMSIQINNCILQYHNYLEYVMYDIYITHHEMLNMKQIVYLRFYTYNISTYYYDITNSDYVLLLNIIHIPL